MFLEVVPHFTGAVNAGFHTTTSKKFKGETIVHINDPRDIEFVPVIIRIGVNSHTLTNNQGYFNKLRIEAL
jgi:hypothetical protein